MNRDHIAMRGTTALLVVMLAGCAMRQAEKASQPNADAEPSAQSRPADLQSVVDAARRDAGAHLKIDPKAIEVVSAVQVSWSDGSLGCPADGMQYTQALVPGYRVILRAADRVLDYHAAANGHVTLCPPERAVDPIQDQPI